MTKSPKPVAWLLAIAMFAAEVRAEAPPTSSTAPTVSEQCKSETDALSALPAVSTEIDKIDVIVDGFQSLCVADTTADKSFVLALKCEADLSDPSLLSTPLATPALCSDGQPYRATFAMFCSDGSTQQAKVRVTNVPGCAGSSCDLSLATEKLHPSLASIADDLKASLGVECTASFVVGDDVVDDGSGDGDESTDSDSSSSTANESDNDSSSTSGPFRPLGVAISLSLLLASALL